MLGNMLSWFKALSIAGKTGLVAASVVVGGTAASSIEQDQPPQSPPSPQTTACTSAVTQETTDKVIDYEVKNVDDANLAQGKTEIRTAGIAGTEKQTFDVTEFSPKGCKDTSRVLARKEIVKEPVTQVVAKGTYVAPPPSPPRCDPNYTPCVPNVSYDLDCPDIGFQVRIIGSDPHGFDGNDNDGLGCESY
jgi:resuscitation-promoting factor RpfB